MKKLVINADICEGHGRCYNLAPEVFAPDAESVNCQKGMPTRAASISATSIAPSTGSR